MRLSLLAVVLGWLLLAASSALGAHIDDSFTISGCASCYDASYTLQVIHVSGDDYQAVFTVDTTGGLSIAPTDIIGVAFKVTSHVDSSSVTSFPGPGAWIGGSSGPLSSATGNCMGVSDGWVCADVSPDADGASVPGAVHAWEFDFTLASGSEIFPDLIGSSIQVKYWSESHPNGWLTSATNPIPEPSSVVLFLAGGVVVAGAVRRRIRT